MESILIEGLRIHARHGVLPQERTVGNLFELDIRLYFNAHKAMESDLVEETVNYAKVIDLVKDVMEEPSALLEHVAGRIRQAVCSEFPVISGGSISIYKIHPPVNAELGRVGFQLQW